MRREFGLDEISHDPTSVVTVGMFDGIHLGHQAILRYLARRAREQGGTSAVLSFSPHPREVVHGEEVPLLTTVEERADLLEELGIDRFIVIPFTIEFSKLSAEEFVRRILVQRVGLREVVIGYDHAFGRDRRGNAELLEKLGQTLAFTVDVIPPQVVNEHVVSSSEIREILAEKGDVRLAASLIGRPYGMRGKVIEGDGRGRQIGFPTANLQIDPPNKVVPATGVYAVHVQVLSDDYGLDSHSGGESLRGMMNIGYRPTIGDGRYAIEVHLLDFDGNLYGRDLRVEFVARMREERKFTSLEALVEQLSNDRTRCMQLLDG